MTVTGRHQPQGGTDLLPVLASAVMDQRNPGNGYRFTAAIQIDPQLILPAGLAGKILQFNLRGSRRFGTDSEHQFAAAGLTLSQLLALLSQCLQLALLFFSGHHTLINRRLPLRHRLANGRPGTGPFFHRHLGKHGLTLWRLPHQGLQMINLLLVQAVCCPGGGHGLLQFENRRIQLGTTGRDIALSNGKSLPHPQQLGTFHRHLQTIQIQFW